MASRGVTIWHNPKCSTSRKVLEMIRAKGIKPTIVDYVKSPPSVADIKAALKEMGAKPRDLLRRRGTPYDELGLDDAKLGDAALVAAMHEHPILIKHPIIHAPNSTRLYHPPERLEDIIDRKSVV